MNFATAMTIFTWQSHKEVALGIREDRNTSVVVVTIADQITEESQWGGILHQMQESVEDTEVLWMYDMLSTYYIKWCELIHTHTALSLHKNNFAHSVLYMCFFLFVLDIVFFFKYGKRASPILAARIVN